MSRRVLLLWINFQCFFMISMSLLASSQNCVTKTSFLWFAFDFCLNRMCFLWLNFIEFMCGRIRFLKKGSVADMLLDKPQPTYTSHKHHCS